MNINVIDGIKSIKIEVRRVGFFGKFIGLMFKTCKTGNLLFEFSKNTQLSIHSIFVFFPFLAVWLDDKNRVVEKRIVKPFTIAVLPKKLFRKLIEIPFNSKNYAVLKKLGFSVGKKRFKYINVF